jgi:hypothetical protein
VMAVPLLSEASITSTPSAIPLMSRFLRGKFQAKGSVPKGNSLTRAPWLGILSKSSELACG